MKCYILIAGLLGTLALASPVADPVADPIADAVADPNDYGYGYGYGHKTCEEISCKPVTCHGTEWDMCKCKNNWEYECKKSCSNWQPHYKDCKSCKKWGQQYDHQYGWKSYKKNQWY